MLCDAPATPRGRPALHLQMALLPCLPSPAAAPGRFLPTRRGRSRPFVPTWRRGQAVRHYGTRGARLAAWARADFPQGDCGDRCATRGCPRSRQAFDYDAMARLLTANQAAAASARGSHPRESGPASRPDSQSFRSNPAGCPDDARQNGAKNNCHTSWMCGNCRHGIKVYSPRSRRFSASSSRIRASAAARASSASARASWASS